MNNAETVVDTMIRPCGAIGMRCASGALSFDGDTLECTVAKVTRFGIMAKLGDGVDGLIHESELELDDNLQVGDTIRALVMRVDFQYMKIGLSRKRLNY